MTKTSLLVTSLLIGFSVLSSCNNADTTNTTPDKENNSAFNLTVAKAQIEEANRNFMRLVAKGNSVGLANAYTTDAKFMSAGAPAVVGRENIQHAMSDIVKSGITKVDLRLKEVLEQKI
ncbi:MAG TPA: hypothetical protein VF540_07205 [Segetibacter sp.]|jgi:hypothetical protein